MAICRKDLRSASAILMISFLGVSLTACVVIDAAPEPAGTSATVVQPPDPSPATGSPITNASPSTEQPSAPDSGPEPVAAWPDVIEEARSGVAHLLVTQCADEGAGTGFLIDDDLVVTAAHVVKDAAEITLRIDDELVSGQILGSNDRSDIALVRLARASEGHQFNFIAGDPEIGTEIQALGFPQTLTVKDEKESNSGFTATIGSVSAADQTARYESGPIGNMIRIDASVDSGNSGGPLITNDGEVVGLVSGVRMTMDGTPVNGWGYAVIAPRIVAAVEEWKERSTMVALKSCQNAPAPEGTAVYSEVASSHDQATSIAHSLVAHGQAINNGNYESAYSIFTGSILDRVGSLQHWSNGIETSYWLALLVDDVEGSGDTLRARARLVTAQDPELHSPDGTVGQACSIWTMDYTMGWDGTRWLMDDVDSVGVPEDCTEEMDQRDNTDPNDDIGD
jgi:serine protease Do